MNKVANLNNIVLYQNETGNKVIEVLYDSEDFWLTQKSMSKLFNVEVNTINYHLKVESEQYFLMNYFYVSENAFRIANSSTFALLPSIDVCNYYPTFLKHNNLMTYEFNESYFSERVLQLENVRDVYLVKSGNISYERDDHYFYFNNINK